MEDRRRSKEHVAKELVKAKKKLEKLQDSEEKYKGLFSLGPQAVVTVDMNGVITSCNPSVTKMTGYSAKELVGKNALKLKSLFKNDIPRFTKIFMSLVKGKVPAPFECSFLFKDGTRKWAFIHVGLFDEGDGKKGIQAVATDITEHKKVEMALRESQEKYLALFDRSLYCVFVNDLEGNFIDANKAALDLLGYKKEDIRSLNFASLLDDNQMPSALEALSEIKKTGYQKKSYQFKLKRKDGGLVWVETEASLLYKEGVPYGILGIARDITEQIESEQALRESEVKYRKIFESLSDVYYLTDR